MQFKKLGNQFVVRIDRGEEIVSRLTQFCAEQNISAGFVSGIGACNRAELKFFWPDSKTYETKTFSGNFEIAAFSGTISQLPGAPYLHVHAVLGTETYGALSGHLNAAWVSATFEAVILPFSGKLKRKHSEQIGLNLFDF